MPGCMRFMGHTGGRAQDRGPPMWRVSDDGPNETLGLAPGAVVPQS
jgi:hypothetical protein